MNTDIRNVTLVLSIGGSPQKVSLDDGRMSENCVRCMYNLIHQANGAGTSYDFRDDENFTPRLEFETGDKKRVVMIDVSTARHCFTCMYNMFHQAEILLGDNQEPSIRELLDRLKQNGQGEEARKFIARSPDYHHLLAVL